MRRVCRPIPADFSARSGHPGPDGFQASLRPDGHGPETCDHHGQRWSEDQPRQSQQTAVAAGSSPGIGEDGLHAVGPTLLRGYRVLRRQTGFPGHSQEPKTVVRYILGSRCPEKHQALDPAVRRNGSVRSRRSHSRWARHPRSLCPAERSGSLPFSNPRCRPRRSLLISRPAIFRRRDCRRDCLERGRLGC